MPSQHLRGDNLRSRGQAEKTGCLRIHDGLGVVYAGFERPHLRGFEGEPQPQLIFAQRLILLHDLGNVDDDTEAPDGFRSMACGAIDAPSADRGPANLTVRAQQSIHSVPVSLSPRLDRSLNISP